MYNDVCWVLLYVIPLTASDTDFLRLSIENIFFSLVCHSDLDFKSLHLLIYSLDYKIILKLYTYVLGHFTK